MVRCVRGRSAAAALAVALAVCAAPATAAAACAGAEREARELGLDEARDAIACLVNERRSAAGRAAWREDGRLALAARRHAEDMVDRGYFAHESPGGRDVLDRVRRTGWVAGRGRWRIGEVLAWGSGSRSTPRALVAAWMRSPGHRRILLDAAFDRAGVGLVRGAPGRAERNALTVALVAGG